MRNRAAILQKSTGRIIIAFNCKTEVESHHTVLHTTTAAAAYCVHTRARAGMINRRCRLSARGVYFAGQMKTRLGRY